MTVAVPRRDAEVVGQQHVDQGGEELIATGPDAAVRQMESRYDRPKPAESPERFVGLVRAKCANARRGERFGLWVRGLAVGDGNDLDRMTITVVSSLHQESFSARSHSMLTA